MRFKIAGHALFWLVSFALLTFIFYFYDQDLRFPHFEKSLIINVGFALAVYFNLYVLVPKFLKQKNYIFYIFWLIVLISFSGLLIQLIFLFPFRNLLNSKGGFSAFNTSLHSAYFFAILAYVALTSLLKFIKEWLSLQDLNLKLAQIEQQKLEAELKTLKGQLNPHFLFNSLNNIYSLALSKNDKVPDLILKLSDLMRHIIYESKENFIPLGKEIEFVENFISLQKIRTSETTTIEYTIQGKVPSARIAPLIFEPFIDNAFKHGLPGIPNKDYVSMTFNFERRGYLRFKIENNYQPKPTGHKSNSGIGIDNVKKRLKLLYKKQDFKLSITALNNVHCVELTLKLM